MSSRFRSTYGASPLHLLSMATALLLAGYTVTRILDSPALVSLAVWFVGAIVVHDLVLFPLYSAADRGLQALGRAAPRGVSPVNHVRVPLLLSAVLLLVWAPLILGLGEETYAASSGLSKDPFLGRWLAVTAALVLGSAALYGLRLGRSARS
jgi:predicted metal-binding membrane protein